MRFTVKQRIMAFGKQYKVLDESENQVFEISSMLFSPERRKEVLDMQGNMVAWSEWPIMSGQAQLSAGQANCSLDIPFMGLTPEWSGYYESQDVTVTGDFMRLSFTVSKAGCQVASIDKRILAFSDTYEVDVDEAAFPKAFAMLIVALIDHKYHSKEGR